MDRFEDIDPKALEWNPKDRVTLSPGGEALLRNQLDDAIMAQDDPRAGLEAILQLLWQVRQDPECGDYRHPVTERLLEYFDPKTGKVDWDGHDAASEEDEDRP